MPDKEPFDSAAETERVRADVLAAGAPGDNPDNQRIIAKHKAAAARAAAAEADDEEEPKVKPTKVQGRTATPPGKTKAAEEK